MRFLWALIGIVVLGGSVIYLKFGQENSGNDLLQLSEVAIPNLSEEAQLGETFYVAKCAQCHGDSALGSENGPPLIHRIYEPGHHGDEAFQRAISSGAKSHHWRFGDMPPVSGITRAEVANIIMYIREIQRANGID